MTTTAAASRTLPRTIDNGAGEVLTFLDTVRDEHGVDRLEVTNRVRPGSGPPMHVHHHQDEELTVVEGMMGWQLAGGPEQRAHPGDTVVFRAGEEHRFWNAGEDDLVCTGRITPPGNLEWFLTQIFASTRAAGGGRPRFFDGAYLSHRYRSEFAMTEIPAPVRRFVFPVVVAAGRLFGLERRFAGAPAPEPVR